MRNIYIVAPNTPVNQGVIDAAATAGCTEIACGCPPRLGIQNPTYPFVYSEPDDPDAAPLALAIAQLRNTFKTARTVAQINNSLDAITVILRRVAGELR